MLWAQAHKYYIGWAMIETQPNKQRIEGTFRWFEDEVDQALFRAFHHHLQTHEQGYTPESQTDLQKYWLAHVHLWAHQQMLTPTIKHIERQDQVVVFYVTWPLPKALSSLQCANDALMEVQVQQEHLIQCKAFGQTQSATLSLHKTQHIFTP